MTVIRTSSASSRERWRRTRGLEGRERRDGREKATPACPALPAGPAPGLLRIAVYEEQNQRDEQHVDDERLDEHEAQNEVASDLAGRARVPRDPLDRRRDRARLSERAER